MSIDFIRPEVDELRPRISVIGVGGAGGNAVANMIRRDVMGVDFIVANTDAQALNASEADRRIQLGPQDHPGARRRIAARDRPRRRRRDDRGNRESAGRRAHVLHRRGHGRGHRHRRRAGDRQGRARQGHPDRRRGDQAVRLRRRAPRPLGRQRDRGTAAACRYADRHPQPESVPPRQFATRPSRKRSKWPTRCSSRASAGSPI